MGEKKKTNLMGLVAIFIASVVIFSHVSCDGYSSSIPEDQAEFTDIVNHYRDAYRSASSSNNNLQQRASRENRRLALERHLDSYEVNGWVGEIKNIGSATAGQNATLAVSIDRNIELKTWNNALSDIGSSTIISSDSPLYEKIFSMQSGQKIIFSGEFIPNDTDHVREGSITLRGSMERPEFIFRFSDVNYY